MRIRRPLCLIGALFFVIAFLVMQLIGGVDEREYTVDNCNVVVRGIITDKIDKKHSSVIYVRGKIEEKICPTLDALSNIDRQSEPLEEKKKTKLCKPDMQRHSMYIVYLEKQKLDDFFIGQYVEAKGVYSNFSVPENDGQFNTRRYYRIRKFEAAVKKARITKASKEYSKYRELLYREKNRTKDAFFSNMSEVEAGTLTAMVLGDKTSLNDEIKEYYQNAGVAHILSLSGLHIATVGMCLFSGMHRTGLGIKVSSIVSLACMCSYGIMTGMSTSTMRALVMFSLGIIAKNIGRTYDLLSAAAMSAILILIENPFYIYDSGFLMSFLSIEGIGLLNPVIYDVSDWLSGNNGFFILEKIKQGVSISISASIATLPVVMNCFYKTSRYGVFSNIIIVPLMTVVLWIGIVAGVISNIFISLSVGSFIKPIGVVRFLLKIDEAILKLYTCISEKISSIKGSIWVTGKAGSIQIIVYIILIAVSVVYYNISGKRNSKENMNSTARSDEYKNKVITVLIIVVAMAVLSYRAKPDLSVNVVSVGQGACNVVYGKNIPTVVIDGGSTDVKNVGKYRIAPFLLSKGIGEVDYLFISHPDADHVNGIKEILADDGMGIKINHIFMSVNDDEIESLANDSSTDYHIMSCGDMVSRGNLSVKCIYPARLDFYDSEKSKRNTAVGQVMPVKGENINNEASESLNDKSLVLVLKYDDDFSCVFPGDISADAEKEIVSRWDLSEINMLSVAHHGSKYSSCEEFLENISPTFCTISAGEGNSYGHPHSETLDRLSAFVLNERIFRTDKSGQVTITLDNRVISVREYK